MLTLITYVFYKLLMVAIDMILRERTLSMWEGARRVLQIFQKIFRNPGDYRPKYFMTQ